MCTLVLMQKLWSQSRSDEIAPDTKTEPLDLAEVRQNTLYNWRVRYYLR